MKLYYSKGACSMAVHIALEELGYKYEAISVDLLKDPSPEFLKLNPMGQVPVLVLDQGEVLTEIAMIVQYLADQKPEAKLAPPSGTMERYRLQEWLTFISSEIHKGFGPLWAVDLFAKEVAAREEIRSFVLKDLGRKFDVILQKLGNQDFVMPSGYTVADAYLYTILNWTHFLKIDLERWPKLKDYMNRIRERPATIRTLKAEHLMS